MDDLISRQAAIDALGEKPLAWTEGEYELGLQQQWEADVDTIKAVPSAQSVVWCRDCKWCNPLRAGEKIEEHGVCTSPSAIERIIGMYAMAHGFIVNVSHYCGYGERR